MHYKNQNGQKGRKLSESRYLLLVITILFLSFTAINNEISDVYENKDTRINRQFTAHLNTQGLEQLIPNTDGEGLLHQKLFKGFFKSLERKRLESEFALTLEYKRNQPLTTGNPEDSGLSSEKLANIDSIIAFAIKAGAMPGAQVFVAHKGVIVYNKAFGHHDYSQNQPVKTDDLYDIASITKIATTTLAAMRLYNENLLNLNDRLGEFFTDTLLPASYNNFNIFRVTPLDLLSHQSGLDPSLSIMGYVEYTQSYHRHLASAEIAQNRMESYDEPVENENLVLPQVEEIDPQPIIDSLIQYSEEDAFSYYFTRTKNDSNAQWQVANNMYLRKEFAGTLIRSLKYTHGVGIKDYEYACLNMILMQMVIDSITGSNLATYTNDLFFGPLGMKNTTYNPLTRVPLSRIVPSNYDSIWRKQLIHGTVHDPSAAMLGGISGNAGLFSTAADLGILGQMLMNEGVYNGRRYFDPEIIRQFTGLNGVNHRGLGFDKPFDGGVHAKDISPEAFGHLGYTGSAMWVDPENEIVFVFLSNRTMPDSSNNKLSTMGIRQRVHQVVYDAIIH